MKIRLADFKEGVATEVDEGYDPKSMELEWVDLKYIEPLRLHGTIEKGPETLTFRGHLTSEIEHTCGRCLKTVKGHLDRPFEFFYEIKDKEVVETLDDLREILLLDHPLTYLCREDCQGLCPHCGTNRNESSCRCERENLPEPFSPFKNLWKKIQEDK